MNGELPPELERGETTDNQDSDQDLLSMLYWVKKNLGKEPDKLTDAQVPDDGYRELLRWARSEPKQFWPIFARYDSKAKDQTKHVKKFEEDQRRHFVLLDRVLANWEQRQADALSSTQAPPAS